jgi:hypothetical protein
MAIKTLAEAAAEILSGSKSSAPAEGTKKLEGEVVDLGGATTSQPDGGEVGKKASANATKVPARPADKPVAAEPSKGTVKEEEESDEDLLFTEEELDLNSLSEEELDDYLNSLTEEELEALEEETNLMEEGDLSVRTLYNRWADHHSQTGSNSLAKANAVEKAIRKVHGAKVMRHLKNALTANLRNDTDAEELHFHKAVSAAGKSDRIGATVGRGRSAFRKEEFELELTEEEIAEAREAKIEMIRTAMKDLGIEEDMTALFGDENLSEDFKAKAATIFETAVISRAITVVEQLEEEILEAAEQSIEEIKADLEENIDSYLGYAINEWKEEHKVAIQSGLRSEIVEDFINGLRNLFAENYIDIPEEQVNVVEELTAKVEELQEEMQNVLNRNIEMWKQIQEGEKKEILLSVCEGLTTTQIEKMKTLAEGVEFTADGEYREKLEVIKESYFSKKVEKDQVSLIETLHEDVPQEDPVVTSAVMNDYVKAISRTLIK